MATPKEIGLRIEQRRKELGLTLNDISDAIGVARSTVQRYEKGQIAKLKLPVIEAMAGVLKVNPLWLICKTNDMTPMSKNDDVIRIPVLGTVPAGIPLEAIEDIQDWEELPAGMAAGGREYFGLRVKGDSMYPQFLDGDTVIVRKQDSCTSGDICVVYVNGYDATLKQVQLGDDGSITLKPRNPEYPPRTYTASESEALPISIAGVVVELRRKII